MATPLDTTTLGIGITTLNRRDYLKDLIYRIRRHTWADFALVVADDGSSDGTLEFLRDENIPVVGGVNRGVAWNKNRALYALVENTPCDPIVIFDDDFFPAEPGWDQHWIRSSLSHGHMNTIHPESLERLKRGAPTPEIFEGSGLPSDPWVTKRICGGVIGSSREALGVVGYMDSRFKHYGHEHSEWTSRMKKVGFGGRKLEREGVKYNANLMIEGGISSVRLPSTGDKRFLEENRALMSELKREPIFRNPWSTPDERLLFLKEVATAQVSRVWRTGGNRGA